MTTTAETATEVETDALPLMADEVREEAEDLIRDLAAVAGDPGQVYARLQDHCRGQSAVDAFATIAAAAVLIFSECITTPTEPGEYAPATFPTH